MKKKLMAGMLLATLATAQISANPLKNATPEDAKFFKYVTTYVTQKVGTCNVTYRITTKYFCGIAICCTKQQSSIVCTSTPTPNPNPGGGTGSNK